MSEGTVTQTEVPRTAQHRPWRRRLGTLLLVVGLLLMAEGAVTLLWKEPFTSFYAQQKQDALAHEFDQLLKRPLPPADRAQAAKLKTDSARLRYLAQQYAHRVHLGQPVGRIVIKGIGARYTVVQGTDEANLQKGPGHYPSTAFPGQGTTVGIAGHRTTYLAPFRHLDNLKRGDRIEVVMPYGTFVYAVTGTKIVTPDRLDIVKRTPFERLVLSACHPVYSASHRIVIDARLVTEQSKQ